MMNGEKKEKKEKNISEDTEGLKRRVKGKL